MSFVNYILAAGDDDWGKVVAGIIGIVIWIISAMASAQNKKKKEQQETRRSENRPPPIPTMPPPAPSTPSTYDTTMERRRAEADARREEIRRQVEQLKQSTSRPATRTVGPTPVPRIKPRPPSTTRIQMPRNPMRVVTPPAPKPPKRKAPAAATPVPVQLEDDVPRSTVATTEIRSEGAAPAKRMPSANAALLHRWLNPNTLRSQFILTEIFQPPISLRNQER
jgi:hypothetical protein